MMRVAPVRLAAPWRCFARRFSDARVGGTKRKAPASRRKKGAPGASRVPRLRADSCGWGGVRVPFSFFTDTGIYDMLFIILPVFCYTCLEILPA